MSATVRTIVSIALYLLAFLALIGAFIVFMRMQEDASDIERLRTHGVVSRAVVTEKQRDKIDRTMPSSSRKSAAHTVSTPIYVLTVRFEPHSSVRFDEYDDKVDPETLPSAPAPTGQVASDGRYIGVMWVSDTVFESTPVGDTLVVVSSPFNRNTPRLATEVKAFDNRKSYPWIAGFLLLGVAFGLFGHRFSKGNPRG